MPTPSKHKRKEPTDRSKYEQSGRSRHTDHKRTDKRDHKRDHEPRNFRAESSKRRRDDIPHIKREVESDSEHRSRRRKDRRLPNPFLTQSNEDKHEWGKPADNMKTEQPNAVVKPDFGLSGKLAEDTNTVNGVVIKYNEPAEARKPKRRWRLYPFKGDQSLPLIPVHRQSAYLIGRARGLVDIPTDHPSCSKQQAVLQYRLVDYQREDGRPGKRVRPYVIDLESANGTFVNNQKIETRCYVELLEKDVLKFGYSSREYVLLHEESKYDKEDDNVLE